MGWLPLAALFAAAPVTLAQPVAADTSCPYAACAIWIAHGFWGTHIVPGPVGAETVLGGVGLFLSDLPGIVPNVPEAHAFAARQQRLRVRSALLKAGRFVLMSMAIPLREELGDGADLGAIVAGVGRVVYGSSVAVDAQRAESRAVWKYIRSLAE